MQSYQKICVICQTSFYSMRIDKLYCSPACKNRTRYMPKALLEDLKERNNKYMIKANAFAASVIDQSGMMITQGKEIEGATKEHPLGKDEGLLIGYALQMKEKRDFEQRTSSEYILNKKKGATLTLRESNVVPPSESNIGFVRINNENIPIDPEMKDFMLEDDVTVCDNTTTIISRGTEEQSVTGRADNNIVLSGVQDHENNAQVVGAQSKKYKIRRIGETK